MQTQTLENKGEKIAPYNDVAELIDDKIHRKMLGQINSLAREYEIRNPSKVAEFLSENLFLLDLLKEIPAQIRKIFGKKQNLLLEFFMNPEDSNWHQLHVFIPTKLPPDKASSAMEKFEEDWWIDNFARVEMKIQILEKNIK